ncbi:hypothetical protein M5D96_013027 [Drosophila gunungcola]|uniref:trypsin n=1 Tax=Drosophila gunungcola TaxID=103775 RepID=A0A9Q0BJH6_9MUSC|nr:hypothetical protein M5D96_013027 [Drosophila gunungcola]
MWAVFFMAVQANNKNDTQIEPWIVGGTNAKDGQFPHQISLRLRGEHNCGGVIVSFTHVITAAHWLKDGDAVSDVKYLLKFTLQPILRRDPAELFTIKAGSLLLSGGGVVVPVATVTVHPNYSRQGPDLAVLRLQSALTFDPNTAAIQQASEDPPDGVTVYISGWGQTSQNGPISDSLLFVQDSGGPATYKGKVVGLASLLCGGCGRAAPDGNERIFKLRT